MDDDVRAVRSDSCIWNIGSREKGPSEERYYLESGKELQVVLSFISGLLHLYIGTNST